MGLSAELLARIQFAFTISFHILFPAFSIGLATFLAIMEGMWLTTKNAIYLSICKFWMKIFALTFGMGIVSGIVMEFQLGTNWAGMTKMVGPVLGSLFTYEVLTAFFIEAGFLGVMIFGWNKVGPKLHYCATLLVFFGVTLSAFWILSANSWMQTPSGAMLQDGQFVVTSWWSVIFNPSVITRYIHMLLAAYVTTILVIMAVSAFYLLKKQHIQFAQKCLGFASGILIVLILAQIMVGDDAGLIDHEYQPIKTAAIEANWETQAGAPLILFAYPDDDKAQNLWVVSIPHLASVINTHQWNGVLQGLDSVPASDRPFVPIVFYSFRVMVGLGFLILGLALWGVVLRFRHRLYDHPWFLKSCVFLGPSGFIALIAGWFTAETGRQPWVVYNLVRTSDAVSDVLMKNVLISLVLIIVVYGIIFGFFYFRYFGKIIKHGPENIEDMKMPFAYLHVEDK
jgi:cytochrome d ubiquinol oxidase subunit I